MLTSKRSHFGYVVFIFMAGLLFFAFGDSQSIYKENGLMENLQVICLAISCLLFFQSGLRLQFTLRYVAFFFSWLSFAFVLRELDIEKLDVPDIVILFGAGKGRAVFLIPLFAVLFYLAKNIRHYLKNLLVYISSATGIYIMLAAVLLISGWPLDKAAVDIPYRVFFEEMFELAGYYFLTIAALISSANLKQLNFKNT